jgi:uncharacterized coiled-coil DUF342 family protein
LERITDLHQREYQDQCNRHAQEILYLQQQNTELREELDKVKDENERLILKMNSTKDDLSDQNEVLQKKVDEVLFRFYNL